MLQYAKQYLYVLQSLNIKAFILLRKIHVPYRTPSESWLLRRESRDVQVDLRWSGTGTCSNYDAMQPIMPMPRLCPVMMSIR